MKALVLKEPFKFEYNELPEPTPKTGEALLKVRSIGICGSDLHAYRGKQPFLSYPRILGHELGCEILEVNDKETELKSGELVTVEPLLYCGECYACRIGKYNCCQSLKVLGVHVDGGMREMMTLPIEKLHRSEKLSTDELALCETLSIGTQAVKNRGKVANSDFVCIIGAGPIGLGAMQVAKAYDAAVAVIEPLEYRRELALKLGADYAIDPISEDAVKSIEKITSCDMASVVIEAVGKQATIQSTVDLVAHGGRIVLIGVSDENVTFPAVIFLRKEITFLGSRNSRRVFPEVLDLAEKGKINLEDMITHRISFDEIVEIFEMLHQGKNEKIIKTVVKTD